MMTRDYVTVHTGFFRFIVKMYHYTTLVICIRFELNKIILKANTGTFDIMFSADLFVVKNKVYKQS